MRKIYSILLIICLAVLLFAGCNRPADDEVSGTAGVSAARQIPMRGAELRPIITKRFRRCGKRWSRRKMK